MEAIYKRLFESGILELETREQVLKSLLDILKELFTGRRILISGAGPDRRLYFATGDEPLLSGLPFPGPLLPRKGRPIHEKIRGLYAPLIRLDREDFGLEKSNMVMEDYPRIRRGLFARLLEFRDLGYSMAIPLLMRGEMCGVWFMGGESLSGEEAERAEKLRKPLALILKHFEYREEIRSLVADSRRELDRLTKFIPAEGGGRKQTLSPEMTVSGALMRDVAAKIDEYATQTFPLLITGETGTGKELAAQALHQAGHLREQPFEVLNCAAVPENLWEDELFGHRKGAFTDAREERKGRVALAGAGTLFFDEIGEIPPPMQARLLRLLQEGTYSPLGAEKIEKAQCRFLFATHRDLEDMSRRGSFRADLYYRIAVFRIHLPPLRRRRSGIKEMSREIVGRYAPELHGKARDLSPEVLRLFQGYHWPGNVRELENILIRALAGSSGPLLELSDLGPLDRRLLAGDEVPARGAGTGQVKNPDVKGAESTSPSLSGGYDASVRAYQRELILQALKETAGNKRKAAGLLEISPQKLDYQIERLELEFQVEISLK